MRTLPTILLLTLISLTSKGQLDIYRKHAPSIDSSDLVIAKLSKQKLYDNALTKLNESINSNPTLGINYFNRAVIKYYKFGENTDNGVDTSIYNDCKKAIKNGYDTPELHYLMFSLLHPNLALYDEDGSRTDITFDDAKKEIDNAINASTDRPIKYRFARMLLLYQKLQLMLIGNEGKTSDAKEEFKEIDNLKFDCSFVLEGTKSTDKIGVSNYILSQISYSLEQDTIAAIKHLTDAILADTSKLQYVEERARMKYEIGNYRGSIIDYNKFLAKDKRAEDFITLGNCYSLISDNKIAITNYTTAISLINAELKLIKDNKSKPASTDYENYAGDIRSNHLKFKLGQAFFNRGISYGMLNNKLKACSDLNQALDFGYKDAQEAINENCQ
jgi:tetratricopeptide (TPR) repeat protein